MPCPLQRSFLLSTAEEDLDQRKIHTSSDKLNGSQPFHTYQWNPGFNLVARAVSRKKSNRIKIRINYEKMPARVGLHNLEYARTKQA